MRSRKPCNRARDHQSGFPKAELDRLVEEATVDCYNEAGQLTGLYTMIDDNLAVPFETQVLGASVVVERVEAGMQAKWGPPQPC